MAPRRSRRLRSGIPGLGSFSLVVLLVGETPTVGVHKTALRNAVKFVDEQFIEQAKGSVGCARGSDLETIRIIGPVFSGSVTSLRLLIDSLYAEIEKKAKPKFHLSFVSGTATLETNRRHLLEALGDPRWVDYRTTTSTNATIYTTLNDYLSQLNVTAEEVALLQESRRHPTQGRPLPMPQAQVEPKGRTPSCRPTPLHRVLPQR